MNEKSTIAETITSKAKKAAMRFAKRSRMNTDIFNA